MIRNGDLWVALLLLSVPLGAACSGSNSGVASPGPGLGTGGASGGPTSLSGDGGVSGSGGGGGTAGAPRSTPNPYDPSVTFTWPETNPEAGAGSLCQAGHYVGTYSCNVTFGDGGMTNYPLTGPVDLHLSEAQDGEFLSVSGGTLMSAAGILTLNATLAGKLNCGNGAFGGTLQNGTLSIFPFPPGGTFAGNLSARFVQTGPKLDGTWTLIGEGAFAGYACTGPWTATWQPN
jgi:hypothetical protein